MKAEHPIRRSVERAGAFGPWLYDREFGLANSLCTHCFNGLRLAYGALKCCVGTRHWVMSGVRMDKWLRAITVDVRGLEPPVCRFPLVILQQARPGAGLGAEVFLTTGEARKGHPP
jgi:hypothetical protein